MKYLYLALVALLAVSCNSIENPTILRIENVNLDEFNTSSVEADAEMVLYNPNPFALDLASADLAALVDSVQIATITQKYDTKMPAESEFHMPIRLELDIEKLLSQDPLNALGKGLQIVSKRELPVNFKGELKVGKGSMKVTVPMDKTEVIKF